MDNFDGTALHEAIETARNDADVAASEDARRYVVGDHDAVTEQDQRTALGARANRAQRANVTGQAVREISGRLQFRRFVLGEEGDTKDEDADAHGAALTTFLGQFATKNRLPNHIKRWASQAMTDGTTAAMVSWDNTRRFPVITDEPWWNGKSGMFIALDAAGETLWAVKEWHDGQRQRRTLYETGRVRKFHREGEGWKQTEDITMKRKGERPFGVPIAVFTNILHPYKPYGVSDVEAVMGNQDALNGVLFDLNAASMLTGMQILTATGVNTEDDHLDVSPGRMLKARNDKAQFGAIPGGNIEQLIAHKHELIDDIAAQFPVPSYRIGAGDFPAGIALIRADGSMIAGVKDRGNLAAPGIVLLAHRATELANDYGNLSLDESILLGVEWEAPDQVDPGTQVEIDRERADLYGAIESLSPVMIRKTRVLTGNELKELLEDREANALAMQRALDRGDVDPAFEDEEEIA